MELSLQSVQMCSKIIDFMTFLFHCLISGFLCWLSHTAVKALGGLGVSWLDGRAYKEDRCWTLTTADYLSLKLLHHPLASYTAKMIMCLYTYRLLFCLLYNIPCPFVEWNNQKMFLICSFPLHSQLSPLFSDPLMLSLFLTGSDLLSNTFQHPTPTTDANLSQRARRFYFCPFSGILSSSATVEHRGFNLCFFQAHLLIRASLIGSQPRAVICSGLFMALRIICYSIRVVSLWSFVGLFFSLGRSDTNCADWMPRKAGEMNHLVNTSFSIFKSTSLVQVGALFCCFLFWCLTVVSKNSPIWFLATHV